MRNATPVLPFKRRRPTHRHYFLCVNFRLFSSFMRTTRAKIIPGWYSELNPLQNVYFRFFIFGKLTE